MPCRSDGYDNSYSDLQRATRVACELWKFIAKQNKNIPSELSAEAIQWVLEHQEADRKRLAEEQRAKDEQKKKQDALAKLTAEEKKLLRL